MVSTTACLLSILLIAAAPVAAMNVHDDVVAEAISEEDLLQIAFAAPDRQAQWPFYLPTMHGIMSVRDEPPNCTYLCDGNVIANPLSIECFDQYRQICSVPEADMTVLTACDGFLQADTTVDFNKSTGGGKIMGNANCHGLFRTLAVKKPSASQELVGDDEDAGPNFWADLCFGNFFIEYGDEGSPATGAEMGIHSVCLVKGGGAMGKLEPKDHSEEELWQTLDVLTQSAQADSDEEEEEELEEASPELGWQLLREGKQRDAAMRSASEARSAVEGASCSANCNGNSRDLMGPRGCLGNMTVSCCGEEEGMDFTLRVTCKGRFGKQEGGASCGGVFDSEEHIHAPNVKVDLYGLCVGKMKAKKLGHQPQDTDCDCESGECLCRPRPKKGVMIGCFGNLETGTLVAGGPEDARQAFKREVAAVATI